MAYLPVNMHTISRRTICSPDAEEYAPALHSVQPTSLVDPELKSFMSSLHWHAFQKLFGCHELTSYENTLFQTIIAEPNLNLSRRFPLDTDCNTQTKKILLENQRAASVPVHGLALDQPHSPYSWNPHLITILTAYIDVAVLLIPSPPFFLSRPSRSDS